MMGVVRIMPLLDGETQQKVIRMLEEWGPRLEAAENETTVVDDATIRAIVAEQRHGATSPASAVPQKGPGQPVVRGTGWTEPRKWEPSKAQTEIFDAMVAHMAGGPNEPVK
jgi:hypothetical protein